MNGLYECIAFEVSLSKPFNEWLTVGFHINGLEELLVEGVDGLVVVDMEQTTLVSVDDLMLSPILHIPFHIKNK